MGRFNLPRPLSIAIGTDVSKNVSKGLKKFLTPARSALKCPICFLLLFLRLEGRVSKV